MSSADIYRRARLSMLAAAGLVVSVAARPAQDADEPTRAREAPAERSAARLERVEVSEDGSAFVLAESGAPFVAVGFNYDHDDDGRLLEDYWVEEWDDVVEDFGEMKDLGANVVRIHLQVGEFLEAPDRANAASLERLARLLEVSERLGLRLDVTGLGCYHAADVPAWYDALSESERWDAQATFWGAVAKTCAKSRAVFCYDLMNEPILAGEEPADGWLAGDFGGKHFVQRIALDLAGRDRAAVAAAWVKKLTGAIRAHDPDRLVTVGVIPWAYTFPGARPLFHGEEAGAPLDFVSVHFYPKKGDVDGAREALAVYDVGKPLVVEEMFPLACSADELVEFIEAERSRVDGWISFYWGATPKELAARRDDFAAAITAGWLERFPAVLETSDAERP